MSERDQPNRWRCTVTGCNPILLGEDAASQHRVGAGHRVAKWPIRSAAGKRRAQARNKGGYYAKYNVGYKSPENRGFGNPGREPYDDGIHPFSEEAFG